MNKFQAEQAVLVVAFKAKAVTCNFTFSTTKQCFLKLLALILRLFMEKVRALMGEEQAVFEQIILSDVKMWSSKALKTFNNFSIIIKIF